MKPLELLNQHCIFTSPYDVYVLFGISRKKYNDCTGGQEKVFREVIKSLKDIEKKYLRLRNSVLAYRDEDGSKRTFYIYVSVNPRDTRKAFIHLQKQFTLINEELIKQVDKSATLNRLDKYWLSSLMTPICKNGNKFLIDIDAKGHLRDNVVIELVKHTKIILEQETKNGFHIITEPFNRKEIEQWLPAKSNDYEIKKDSLLFVEWMDKE